MSLHAQLSPEAQKRLAKQKRTSTITSLIIAFLLMVLLVVVMMIISIVSKKKVIAQIVAYSGVPEDEQVVELKKVDTKVVRKPTTPANNLSKTLATTAVSQTSIPVADVDFADPSVDFGVEAELDLTWTADNQATLSSFGNIPSSMKKRCSKADRLERLRDNGGTPECEDSVVAALGWIKKTQNKDGSWSEKYPVGMTGLSILSYMGHCETAQSPEFGESVLDGINYLINQSIKNDGKLASDFKDQHWVYEHAIAAYALSEAYTLCVKSFGENIDQLDDAVQKSGQFLIDRQLDDGGWAYGYAMNGGRGDTSISGWHLQALKAMDYTGIEFKGINNAIDRGIDFVEKRQLDDGSVGYTSRKNGTSALAAVGALCFQIHGSTSDKTSRMAVDFVDKNLKFDWDTPDSDLYEQYYAVQAMINHGGNEWKRYNRLFRDQVLDNQGKDGHYKPTNKGSSGGPRAGHIKLFAKNSGHGAHYRHCLATLMLEAYYRFLPATGKKAR